jgi:hypothetical protein
MVQIRPQNWSSYRHDAERDESYGGECLLGDDDDLCYFNPKIYYSRQPNDCEDDSDDCEDFYEPSTDQNNELFAHEPMKNTKIIMDGIRILLNFRFTLIQYLFLFILLAKKS